MKTTMQSRAERQFQKAMAMESVRNYCKENGLSWDRLKNQRFDLLGMTAVFSQPSEAEPQGLVNDLETRPMPTLIIRYQDEKLIFEQTEYTKRYLA